MLRIAFAALAVALVSACASLPSPDIASIAPSARVDAVSAPEVAPPPETDAECIDVIGRTEPIAAPATASLQRRLFGPPSRRQPDQRLVLATALDRARTRARRRKSRHERRKRERRGL